jgi:threonylcarbamoyladenosine tRNA methylthiotransferase MtaB
MIQPVCSDKTIAFYTLGCKLNFSETSGIARTFVENGYKKVEFEQGADVVVINTCSVTDQADKKCRNIVRQAKRLSPNAFVAVIGCYAQLKPEEISKIEGVNLVLGAGEKFNLIEHVEALSVAPVQGKVLDSKIETVKEFVPSYSWGDRTRTFLKVQDGCNYHCAFCTIPLARGNSRSSSIESVVEQAREIAAKGVKEIVLTGVNIGDFGLNGEVGERYRVHGTFFDLVKALDEVDGIDRFRISSIEPNLLKEEIIDWLANSNKFVPHFHLPLQSGSDVILKKMHRRYKTALYHSRIERILERMPNACIGVDVITGFPGESDAEFRTTFDFLHGLPIGYIHAFTYSERANTEAVQLPDSVPYAAREERTRQLQSLSEKKKRAFYESQKGAEKTILVEHEVKNGFRYGFTENYIKVKVPEGISAPNTLMKVNLNDLLPETMYSFSGS